MKHCANPQCSNFVRFGDAAEFRDEALACSDCGGSLTPGEAPDPQDEIRYRELVTIYEAPDPIRGHLLRSILQDREIPSVVVGDALAGAIGELPATVLQIRVEVTPEFAARASEIARAFDRGDYDA